MSVVTDATFSIPDSFLLGFLSQGIKYDESKMLYNTVETSAVSDFIMQYSKVQCLTCNFVAYLFWNNENFIIL